ncbi:MAG TPA: hypothetical protein VGF26_27620, partial [Ramlibacter sp.]
MVLDELAENAYPAVADVRAHLREHADAIASASVGPDGGNMHAVRDRLLDLAEETTLSVAASGNLLWYNQKGTRWQICAVGSGMPLLPDKLLIARKNVTSLALYLERNLVGADGEPLAWRAANLPQIARTWRSDKGLPLTETIVALRADFDRQSGLTTSPAIKAHSDLLTRLEQQAVQEQQETAQQEHAAATGRLIVTSADLITGDEVEFTTPLTAADRKRLDGDDVPRRGEHVVITGTLLARPSSGHPSEIRLTDDTGRWRHDDGRHGQLKHSATSWPGERQQPWEAPRGPVMVRRDPRLQQLTITHVRAGMLAHADAIGISVSVLDAITTCLDGLDGEAAHSATLLLRDHAARVRHLSDLDLDAATAHVRAAADAAETYGHLDPAEHTERITNLAIALAALGGERLRRGGPPVPTPAYRNGWQQALHMIATGEVPDLEELSFDIYRGARDYTIGRDDALHQPDPTVREADEERLSWRELLEAFLDAEDAAPYRASTLPRAISSLHDLSEAREAASRDMTHLLMALDRGDADAIADYWASISDYLTDAIQRDVDHAAHLLDELAGLLRTCGYLAPSPQLRQQRAGWQTMSGPELAIALRDLPAGDDEARRELEQILEASGWQNSGLPRPGSVHLLDQAQQPSADLVGRRVAYNAEYGQILGILHQDNDGDYSIVYHEGDSPSSLYLRQGEHVGTVAPADLRLRQLNLEDLFTDELDAIIDALAAETRRHWRQGRRFGDPEFETLLRQHRRYLLAWEERPDRAEQPLLPLGPMLPWEPGDPLEPRFTSADQVRQHLLNGGDSPLLPDRQAARTLAAAQWHLTAEGSFLL